MKRAQNAGLTGTNDRTNNQALNRTILTDGWQTTMLWTINNCRGEFL
jgi:hypothetical protein